MRYSVALLMGSWVFLQGIAVSAMRLPEVEHSCNFIDKTSVASYREYLNIEVSEGHMTDYQADVLMAKHIAELRRYAEENDSPED